MGISRSNFNNYCFSNDYYNMVLEWAFRLLLTVKTAARTGQKKKRQTEKSACLQLNFAGADIEYNYYICLNQSS